jgi:GT2 family glycosyltransferase
MTKNDEIPRVVIAVPLGSPFIYWRVVAALLEMERPLESDLMVFQGALVDRARNSLVDQMLNHPLNPTHIFFLDADIVPASDTLMQLLRHRLPIVSGLYRKRLPPHEPLAFLRKGRALKPIAVKGPRLKQADVVGGGCLLIRREVFEKIRGPWFTSEWRDDGHLSEDFSFCEKARKAGYKILVDTAVKPSHLEPMGIGTDRKGKVSFIPLE